MDDLKGLHQQKWLWVTLFCALTFAIILGGYVYYRNLMQATKKNEYQKLHAIAELKVKQLREWRRERLADLQVLGHNPYFAEAVEEYVRQPDAKDAGFHLRNFLMVVRNGYRYHDVLIIGLNGQVLVSAMGETLTLDPVARRTVSDAVVSHKALFGDFYRCSVCGRIHIDAVAPILGEADQPVAVIVVRVDPETDLYSIIQSWPVLSNTAETLLVRKEGEHVLFLNELRHRSDTALNLRESLTKTDLPAGRAVLGKEEHFEGKDYRDVPVLADVLPIPDSPWFIVAKVDTDEVLSEVHREATVVFIFVVMLIFFAGTGTSLIFIFRQKSLLADLYQTEKERTEAREELRAALYGINDGVIITDKSGCVRYMNPVAERLTGWMEAEARGQALPEVFHVLNETNSGLSDSSVFRGMREDEVVWLAKSQVLIAKDGTEYPIMDRHAPVRDENGVDSGTVLVFHEARKESLLRRFLKTRLSLINFAGKHKMDELLTRALDEIGQFVESPIGFYHFVEPDQKTLSLQQWSTRTLKEFCRAEGKGMHYSIDQAGVWADCLLGRKPVIHNDYASLPHKKGMPEGHAEVIRELVVPVIREDKVVAILGLGNKPKEYTLEDVEMVSHLADVTWEIIRKKRGEDEQAQLMADLTEALAQVKKLSGFLPICASCKKIRDDQGYWRQVEEYIRDHSEAEFSHSICPACAKKLYPDFFKDDSKLGSPRHDHEK
jgi:two-component system, cell cycle sensor histidine kinase and response regulator CckA